MEQLEFNTDVIIGPQLKHLTGSVAELKKRCCFHKLHDNVFGNSYDKVLILYGLKNTGKTTLMYQLISEMSEADLMKTAVFKITAKDTLHSLNKDLKLLESAGFRYVFLDDVTMMEDFIQGAAMLSDVYAACGMKIVVSGDDSLSFHFVRLDQLYDRCIILSTTHISYREAEDILGMEGIDAYIQRGGRIHPGFNTYSGTPRETVQEDRMRYLEQTIGENIQNSLKHYQYEIRFGRLSKLYQRGLLLSTVRKEIEEIHCQILLEVLTKEIQVDTTDSFQNETRIIKAEELLLEKLKTRAAWSHSPAPAETERKEIQKYLNLIDFIDSVDIYTCSGRLKGRRPISVQPGVCWDELQMLLDELVNDVFSSMDPAIRSLAVKHIQKAVKTRIMEDIVLLETKRKDPKKDVFLLETGAGQHCMTAADQTAESCQIYAVQMDTENTSRSTEILTDTAITAVIEHRYGSITGKFLIYPGQSYTSGGIQYLNVEEYLKSLGNTQLAEGGIT